MSAQDFARQYLEDLKSIIDKIDMDDMAAVMDEIAPTLCTTRRVFIAGNGGSAATASHMANDLMKTVAKACGKSIRAIALSDNVPLLTAIGNDNSFDEIFSGQLKDLGQEGDLLVVISGSGNSQNLVEAVNAAKEMNIRTVGFLGMDGGKLRGLCDVSVIVPSDDYGPIEDIHVIFNHLITAYLKQQ